MKSSKALKMFLMLHLLAACVTKTFAQAPDWDGLGNCIQKHPTEPIVKVPIERCMEVAPIAKYETRVARCIALTADFKIAIDPVPPEKCGTVARYDWYFGACGAYDSSNNFLGIAPGREDVCKDLHPTIKNAVDHRLCVGLSKENKISNPYLPPQDCGRIEEYRQEADGCAAYDKNNKFLGIDFDSEKCLLVEEKGRRYFKPRCEDLRRAREEAKIKSSQSAVARQQARNLYISAKNGEDFKRAQAKDREASTLAHISKEWLADARDAAVDCSQKREQGNNPIQASDRKDPKDVRAGQDQGTTRSDKKQGANVGATFAR